MENIEMKKWRESQNYEIGHIGWSVLGGKWYQVKVIGREYYPLTNNFRRHVVKILNMDYTFKRITIYTRKEKEELK